ncbi:Protein scarlet [Camponotus floridanus]|uniref:Protein scarlet n=1 Tax=Camponotus floridanus TaxID=104421 RepID=E2AJI9_CAMFO|nr:Protein scarlet [Camponotus floridanus]
MLSWQNLSVYAMDRNRHTVSKQLINNVRGVVRPGELTAILGGSGAGKSSLMTALAFRTESDIVVHGDIRVDGALATSSYMRHHSGFMHQEDMFIDTMTVLEHIWFMVKGNTCELRSFKEPHCWLRLYWLIHRGFLQVLRDPSVQFIRILQKISVATVAGLCFVGAINLDQLGIQAVEGVIFLLVSENTFFPMYATLALIPQDLPLLFREYKAGMYPVHLYYAARMMSLIPGLLVEPMLFAAIIYWIAGLRPTMDAFGSTILIVVLTMNVSTACGCFFSAVYKSMPLAMAYLVPFDYIFMLTMGPFIKLSSLPVYIRWVRYFSWLLHSTETLTIVQWEGVHNISCETVELPCLTEGTEVLDRYDFNEHNFWPDIILMAVIYIVFHLLAYIFLWKRCRSR